MTSAIGQHRTQFSKEEYFLLEERSLERHEFFSGEIFATAGGSFNHSIISTNITTQLTNRLGGSGCVIFNNDVKIFIPANSLFTYPDASVVCEPIEPYGDRSDIYINPMLIVEVPSPSTMAYDRGDKFGLYSQLASFREYALVWQDEVLVETCVKQRSGQWAISRLTAEETLPIESLDLELPIDELYQGVSWFQQ